MKLPYQIKFDLAGEIRGEVLVNDAVRNVFATAACIYRILPLAVVRPRDSVDVAKVVRYAADNSIPITPRGGGSGVAGHSVGSGIILDFVPYMRSILAEGEDWIEVQSGLVLDKLNAHLAKRRMKFAPDPSSSPYCTIGGMVANNSSGARGIKYGSTRAHVKGLEIVTAAGQIVSTDSSDSWVTDSSRKLEELIASKSDIVAQHKPKVTKNSSGYEVWDLARPGGELDMARLIVGSEGTLAVVTRAKLNIVPAPHFNGAVLISFPSLDHATTAVPSLRENSPSAIEVLDDSFIELLRASRADLLPLLPLRGQCLLLVEQDAETGDELRDKIAGTQIAARKAGAANIESAADPKGVARLWEVRKAGSPLISSIPGPKRPVRFVEDMVVPPERFAEFVGKFTGILRKYDCVAPVIGHAGDGNIHVNPLLNLSDPAAPRKIERIAKEVYALVRDFDGSLSGEHGDGRLRAPYLRDHFGKLVGVFEEIKRLFDPKGVFNPGIILGDGKITDFLRPPPVYIAVGGEMDSAKVHDNLMRCHGCGLCRASCPVFDAMGIEEMSPRGRIALIRSIGQGGISGVVSLKDAEVQLLLEVCVACGRCETGCATGIGIPAVISCAKAALGDNAHNSIADNMLKNPRQWIPCLARMGWVGQVLQRVSQPIVASKTVASILGLNPDRPYPIISAPSLKVLAGDFVETAAEYDAIYFPGCYATFIDPVGTGMAVLKALDSLGVRATIASFACCGLPMAASGDREGARNTLANALNPLLSAKKVPIITSCPSCSMMLKGEIFGLEPLPGQMELADRVTGVEAFILNRMDSNSFAPLEKHIKAAHHISCHQRYVGEGQAALELLKLLPGIEIESLPDACCGMGGTFGMRYRNRRLAADVGESVIEALKNSDAEIGLSSCGSCRMALSTVRPTVHPISLIAGAIAPRDK